MTRGYLIVSLVALVACAADPGTRPTDMSATRHEAAARRLEAAAASSPDAETAKKEQRVAAEHREASREFLEAEATACAGVAPADQDACPLRRDGEVIEVEEYLSTHGRDLNLNRVVGASIVLRQTPSRSKESLERLVSCSIAHNAVRGGPAPESLDCPLAVNGTKAEVHRTAKGLQVDLRGDDANNAEEILRRSRALVAR